MASEVMNRLARCARAALPVLGLVLLALAFQHAGRRPHEGERPGATTLTWLVPISSRKPATEAMADAFRQRHPDIHLRLIWVPPAQYPIKFKTLAAAGQPPDVFDTGDVWVAYMLPFLLDLTPLAERDAAEIGLDDFYPGVLEATRYDGRYYFLPHSMNVSLLYYNQDAFDRAGLAYPSAQWTWEDFARAGRALTLRDPAGQVVQWGSTSVEGWWGEWLIYVRQAGGQPFSDDGRRCLLDSPEAVRGLRFFHEKVYRDGFSPPPGRGFPGGFAGQRHAMVLGGHVGDWRTYNAVPSLNWDVQVLPAGPAGRSGGEMALGAYGISRHCRHPEAAWTLLKFLVSHAAIEKEVRSGALSVRRSVADRILLAPDRRVAPQNIGAVYAQLEHARPIPRLPNYIEVALNVIQPEIDLMMQDRQTPEQAAQRAAAAANAFLETLAPGREP